MCGFDGQCDFVTTDCDDGKECTFDYCDASQCAHKNLDCLCDDENACTIDSCNADGTCAYDEVYCDDGNPCEWRVQGLVFSSNQAK